MLLEPQLVRYFKIRQNAKLFFVALVIIPIIISKHCSFFSTAGFFEKYFDDYLVLSASNLLAGVFLALAPWFRSLETVLIFIFIASFAIGVFDICKYSKLCMYS